MSAETDRSQKQVDALASRLARTGEWRLRQTIATAIEELDDVAHAAQEKWEARDWRGAADLLLGTYVYARDFMATMEKAVPCVIWKANNAATPGVGPGVVGETEKEG